MDMGVNVAIVVGGGNIYRGMNNSGEEGIKQETGHFMGMLATCINCMALSDIFESVGVKNKVLSAYGEFNKISPYSEGMGLSILSEGKALLLAGGTGKPFCSTDTAAAIRAKELNVDLILKLTKVDGVYDSDPMVNKNAIKFDSLTFGDALEKNLKVMDKDAFSICQKSNVPIYVCEMKPINIKSVVLGQKVGTIIHQ
jgi:uridylate kinase